MNKLSGLTLLFFFILSFCLIKSGYAETPPKPLWTPEKAVTLPAVDIEDISSDGKYSLIKLWKTTLVEGNAEQSSECILVDNKSLEMKTFNKESQSCFQLQFIGEGKKFSYMLDDDEENKPTLFAQDISSGKITKVQEFKERFHKYSFAPNGESYAFTLQDKPKQTSRIKGDGDPIVKENLYIQKVDENFLPVGDPQLVTPTELNLYHPTLASSYAWSPDSQKIIVRSSALVWKSPPRVEFYLIDLKGNKIEKIGKETQYAYDPSFSNGGQKLAFIKYDEGGEQTLPLRPFKDIGPNTIQVFDLKTQKMVSLLAVDIWNIVGWKEDDKALIVTKQDGTEQNLYFLDLETQKLTLMEAPNLTSLNNVVLSQNKKFIGFKGENLHHPAEIYISNVNTFSPKKITSFNEKNDLSSIRAEPIHWKSFDGLEIEGIITYPQTYKEGQKVPLIVSLHGGPGGVESQIFIGNTSFGPYSPAVFASEGYATLVVNYRGSLGYGDKFQHMNYQDLGRGDFKDVITGVDYLIDRGIADPNQLFIRGHSYGGFMTAWAIGHTHRFKAASVEAGIVDWISHIATTDGPDGMEAYFGVVYWEDYKLWRESSPLSYVNHMKTPALILHGASDIRVPGIQAMQLYSALKERGTPTRFIYYRGQGHGINDPVATLDAMKEKLKWFKAYRN